ncbi:MAG: tRNA (cytidine(34)-2'-O)-methyltransferase [Elusimicrobia bacterium]|nr:tRNA (cytidine(34)-2'-O)-methyltransferase [Elusimicrobiota bacterium]
MHIVLYQPEIPWNTGNIGRTCVAAGAALHLIKPLGFRISGREIRRAGLDYWPKLELTVHEDLAAFLASLPARASVLVFTTKARASFRDAPFRKDSYLLFGRESSGLPEEVMRRFSGSLYRIPVSRDARSLNLSTAAALALYEGLRATGRDP